MTVTMNGKSCGENGVTRPLRLVLFISCDWGSWERTDWSWERNNEEERKLRRYSSRGQNNINLDLNEIGWRGLD